jgi:hypothetical protein
MKKTVGILLATGMLFPTFSFAMDTATYKAEVKKARAEIKQELKSTKIPLNVSCVQDAIKTREESLITGFDVFAQSTKTALITRKDALVIAWSKTDAQERRKARQVAYDTHQTQMKKAHESLKSVRKNAWNVFNTTVKTCGSSVEGYKETTPIELPTSL